MAETTSAQDGPSADDVARPAEAVGGATAGGTDGLFRELEPRLREALLAYGASHDAVDDAIGETFLYLCANSERVLAMDNPRGYLFQVARDRVRGRRRKNAVLPLPSPTTQPELDPGLVPALARLSRNQRVAVFLGSGLGWTWADIAEFLGTSVSTVRNHHRRGIEKLRHDLGGQP